MRYRFVLYGILFMGVLLLAACGSESPTPTAEPVAKVAEACPEAQPCPACPTCPEAVVQDVPFEQLWASSPHADASSVAFTYWDNADPAEVPPSCAKCHSTSGFQDFLGLDGSEAGVVDKPAPIGTVVNCSACHNQATAAMSSVTFPSGLEINSLGPEARCMQCHQGRTSTLQVNGAIEKAGLVDDLDKTNEELAFINIHYYAAGATLYGTQAKGGYEYAGKSYDAKFEHVAGFDSCVSCHNPHTLEVEVEACSACHTGVASQDDLKDIRMAGSMVDYDGDGDTSKGVYYEIGGLQEKLLQAIQAYANEISGKAIVYDSHSHPYWFIDSNENGVADPEEVNRDNRYNAWTGRLLQAAYNYQVSKKDPGGYAHGGKYLLQLLHDSIADLNTVTTQKVDLSTAVRDDAGHFAASTHAFRYWDAQGEVPAACARCHTASGLPLYLKEGVNIGAHPSSGLACASCHNDLATFTRFEVGAVKFSSGVSLDSGSADSNLCLNCHQGRESTTTVNAAITRAGVADDAVSEALSFRNPHYFPAAATLFGTEAKGAYEYAGQAYNGRFTHLPAFSNCIQCHDSHSLEVNVNSCSNCHGEVKSSADLVKIRFSEGDFDGDGDAAEGLAGEISTMKEALLAGIQEYAAGNEATVAIVYDAHSHPYWFIDTNENGVADADEVNSGNRYNTWTPRLLRAAFNYQWVSKDPGAYAHNGLYMIQVLYDSLNDIGVDTSGMTRPAVTAP
jgi:hypothetical protein